MLQRVPSKPAPSRIETVVKMAGDITPADMPHDSQWHVYIADIRVEVLYVLPRAHRSAEFVLAGKRQRTCSTTASTTT